MTQFWKLGVGLVAVALSVNAHAHGAARQKVVQSVTINAPAPAVWALVGDFNGWNKWLPGVTSSTDTDGNKVGAERTLVLGNGSKIIEYLEQYDASAMTLRYRIHQVDTKVLPVATYSSIISVTAAGPKQSTVEWKGAFFRADQNFDPPPGQDDAAAISAVTKLYTAGLANLKKVAESGGH